MTHTITKALADANLAYIPSVEYIRTEMIKRLTETSSSAASSKAVDDLRNALPKSLKTYGMCVTLPPQYVIPITIDEILKAQD